MSLSEDSQSSKPKNKYIAWLQRRFPLIIAIGIVVIAIGEVTGAIQKTCELVGIDWCSGSRNIPDEKSIEPLRTLGNNLFHEFREATRGKRPPLGENDFVVVNKQLVAIEQLDMRNGHFLYYSGAKLRWMNMREESHSPFYLYLQFEPKRVKENKDGDEGLATVCLNRANGYCRERTSWIRHQLAFDIFCQARTHSDPRARIELLGRSLEFVKDILKDRPKGFDQKPTTIALKGQLERSIAATKTTFGNSAGEAPSQAKLEGPSDEVSVLCPPPRKP